MPLDKDIVREMWVLGDLKDRLGIKHRRDRKRAAKAEQAPMFHNPHYRSESEISHAEEDYATPQAYTPPMSHTPMTDGSPRTTAPLMAGESPRQLEEGIYIAQGSPVPSPAPSRSQLNASPASQRLSYYSASNIPPPSPLPESNRYHEYTRNSTARSTAYGLEPPMSAVSHSSVTYSQSPSSPYHLSPPSSATLQVPGMRQQQRSPSPQVPEQYEMHVRTPTSEQWASYPHEQQQQHLQHPPQGLHTPLGIHTPMATEDSYRTAPDVEEDPYDGYAPQTATSASHGQQPQDDSWRNSTYSYSGPHAI